jgi:hypothetical protein
VSLTRRNLLMGMVLAQPVAMSLSRLRVKDESNPRISAALNLRQTATAKQAKRPVASMVANGDESRFPGRISFAPTISDEIDKLAFNIGWRDWASIHYRSDGIAGSSHVRMSRSQSCKI